MPSPYPQAIEGNFGPELMSFMHQHVEEKMRGFGLVKQCIPSPEEAEHCEVFLSSDYAERKSLLVLVAAKRETPPGLWSRGLCLSHGLDVGSMLPIIQTATKAGTGLLLYTSFSLSLSLACGRVDLP